MLLGNYFISFSDSSISLGFSLLLRIYTHSYFLVSETFCCCCRLYLAAFIPKTRDYVRDIFILIMHVYRLW